MCARTYMVTWKPKAEHQFWGESFFYLVLLGTEARVSVPLLIFFLFELILMLPLKLEAALLISVAVKDDDVGCRKYVLIIMGWMLEGLVLSLPR